MGRYKILEHLKSGGFTETYLAKDDLLPGNPQCVVKQLKPRSLDPLTLQAARNLFDTEARVLDILGHHDQIPSLLAYFEENEEFYLIEEFIDGESLDQEQAQGQRLSEPQVIALLQDVLEVLKFIHQSNVIHRDIKPSNIIRRKDGKVVLTGFGSVKQVNTQVVTGEGETSFTVPVGTNGYMPNEQQGGKPRFSSDIYALGMTAIHALSGTPPSKLQEDPQTGEVIWRYQTQIGDRLATILDKMVKSHYRDRYQTVDEVIHDLQNLTTPEIEVPPDSEFTSGSSVVTSGLNWQKIRKPVSIVALVAVVAIIGSIVAYLNLNKNSTVFVQPLPTSTATPTATPEPTPEPTPTTAAEFVERGYKRLDPESAEYEEALADFEEALKLNSNLPEALSGKNTAEGLLLLNEQKYQEALAKFDKAAEIKPDAPYPWVGKGDALRNLQKYPEALTAYEKATQVKPDYPWGWAGKGWSLFFSNKYKEAIVAYDKALELKSDNPLIWSARGDALANLEQYKEAITSYEKAIAINENYLAASVGKAYALFLSGKLQEGLAAIDKAVKIDDNSAYAWIVRGDLLNHDGGHEGALASYERAIKIDAKNYPAWRGKSNALLKLRRFPESIKAADEALNFTPKYPLEQAVSWNYKANALYESRQLQEARLAYEKVVQLAPNGEGGWSNLSELLNLLKEYDKALEAAEKALKIKQTIGGWNQQANALFGLKQYLKAIAAYDQVLKLKPDYHYAWVGKGNAFYELGQYKDAVAAYDKALEIQPKDRTLQEQSDKYATWNYKGKALLADKRYEDALNAFNQAIEIKADFADGWFNKGRTHHELKQYKESLDAYNKVLEIKPDYAEAKVKREEVLQLQKVGQPN
ncbi:MAG: tetratricopeptide repeat protein [Microcoleus sp.]